MSSDKLRLVPPSTPDERRKAGETSARVKLIRHRRVRAWTTEKMAAWLGCSPDAVQLWEAGKRRVPAWVNEALALDKEAA